MPELTEDYITQRLRAAQNDPPDPHNELGIIPDPAVEYRCAAVLIPLMRYRDEWLVLFTRRTDRVDTHKGQVSFPGGGCHEGETTPEQTALRETDEEIGVHPKDVRVLGRMKPLITISDYHVTPVVGVIPYPYAFKTAGYEVARVFTIPLLWLAEKNHFWEFYRREVSRSFVAFHPYDGELVWGATGIMTVNFLKVIGLL
jgi:8-oxo-dGTP pyrophosphatase MutT (NUDIX family)